MFSKYGVCRRPFLAVFFLFLETMGSVVVRSSQGHFFYLCLSVVAEQMQIDHHIPRSCFGKDSLGNYKSLCASCHKFKTSSCDAQRIAVEDLNPFMSRLVPFGRRAVRPGRLTTRQSNKNKPSHHDPPRPLHHSPPTTAILQPPALARELDQVYVVPCLASLERSEHW